MVVLCGEMGYFVRQRLGRLVAGEQLVYGDLLPGRDIEAIRSTGIPPDDQGALVRCVALEAGIQ